MPKGAPVRLQCNAAGTITSWEGPDQFAAPGWHVEGMFTLADGSPPYKVKAEVFGAKVRVKKVSQGVGGFIENTIPDPRMPGLRNTFLGF
jgi:hypothetical protein